MGEVMCGPNTDHKHSSHKRCHGWHMTTRRVDSAIFNTDLSEGSFHARQNKKITDGLSLPGLLSVCEGP